MHSYYVMFYSWVFAQHLQEVYGFDINYRTLLEKGMFHDLDESITGDVIRSFKHHDEKLLNEMTRVSLEVMGREFSDLPGGGSKVISGWRLAKDATFEGRLVDLADVWSVYIYMKREIVLGNKWAQNHVVLLYRRILEHEWDSRIKSYALTLGQVIHEECNL